MILLLVLIPTIYFTLITFLEIYKKIDKKNRTHKTKIALYLIMISTMLTICITVYVFNIINQSFGSSYWLVSSLYFFALLAINIFNYFVIKKSRSHKNITKLSFVIFTLIMYIPLILWLGRVYSAGIYQGKFGASQQYAQKIVDQSISSRVNHNVISSYRSGDNWHVTVDLISKDSEVKINKRFVVGINNGSIINTGKKLSFSVTKALLPIDEAEIVIYSSNSGQTQNTYDWHKIDYLKTDENGVAQTNIEVEENVYYFLQIKDCSLACQSIYFKLSEPIKEEYIIDYNPLQYNVVEL